MSDHTEFSRSNVASVGKRIGGGFIDLFVSLALYLVGLIVVVIDKDNRRLGDFAGGTRVVNDD